MITTSKGNDLNESDSILWLQEITDMKMTLFLYDRKLLPIEWVYFQWQEVTSMRVSLFPMTESHLHESESISNDRKSLPREWLWQEVTSTRVSLFPMTGSHFHESESISNDRKSLPCEWVYFQWQEVTSKRMGLFPLIRSHNDKKPLSREWVYMQWQEVTSMRVCLFLMTGSHFHETESISPMIGTHSCENGSINNARTELVLTMTWSHFHEIEYAFPALLSIESNGPMDQY